MTLEEAVLVRTRLSLHGVAELVLAGPQHARSGTIRLRATPGGFGTVAEPALRVAGTRLVHGGGELELHGRRVGEVADAAGVTATSLAGVYGGGSGLGPDSVLDVDPVAAGMLARAFEAGDLALGRLAPGRRPVLWPEHFDIAVTLDEVNYGVSAGDEHVAVPYAYVGPWTPRAGAFWNLPFGAARRLSELNGVAGVLAFFEQGRALAAHPPGEQQE